MSKMVEQVFENNSFENFCNDTKEGDGSIIGGEIVFSLFKYWEDVGLLPDIWKDG